MPSSSPPTASLSFFQTATFGTLCGLFSAIGYTACNACLRAVSTEVDPFFVAAMRAVPTVLMLGPLVIARPLAGLPMLPPARVVVLLILGGLLAHVGGNSLFQYSLSVVGMALAVPLCLGAMILGGAAIGRVALNEPITSRMAVGLLLLIVAISVLSGGAHAAQKAMDLEQQANVSATQAGLATTEMSSPWELTFGVVAACVAGMFYTTLGAVIRHATSGLSNVSQTLTIVSTAGLVALAGICWYRMTPQEFGQMSSRHMIMMVAAGVLNAVAFIALTRALQLTSLVYVQALNATQATMAALAGIAVFGEAISQYLMAGLALTIAGLGLMHRSKKR